MSEPAEAPPVAPARDYKAWLRWALVGSQGIRAGWSILIFLSMPVALNLIILAIHHWHIAIPTGEIPPRFFLKREIIGVIMVLGATAVMGWIEGKKFWQYGLASSRGLTLFLVGMAGGLACLSSLVGALYAGGYLAFDGFALHGALQALGYGALWLVIFILVGVSEETTFRGYMQSTLARGMGFWPGAVLLSLLFAAAHYKNTGESIAGLGGVVIAGLLLALLLRATGSLWLSIGFHATWDWGQSFLYGTPDSGLMMQGHLLATHALGDPRFSGGTVGPEGSLLFLPVQIVGLLVLLFILQRAGLLVGRDHWASRPALGLT